MKRFERKSYTDLLDKVAGGDQNAFSQLYNLFYPSLLQHVISKVNDVAAAEDILHDLFYSLWKNRQKLPRIESLPAYLFTSCRYLILDFYRKSSVAAPLESIDDWDGLVMDQPLEERLYYRYLLDMVNKEIENLPKKCRQVFKLSREQHKSNREIADYLQISESTVENHIREAIKRLRSATKDLNMLILPFI